MKKINEDSPDLLDRIGGLHLSFDIYERSQPQVTTVWEKCFQTNVFKNLESLFVTPNDFFDDNLKLLVNITNLKTLHLNFDMSDLGVAHLKALNNLELLYLGSRKVTDASVASLKDLKNLSVLDLVAPQMSVEGILSLKELLPQYDCDS